jgi:hypothetical protein
MSFLFQDDVLAKLLVESGLFADLNKYGQQVSSDAKLVAAKLAKSLMEQAIDQSGARDEQVYVQNLADLDSYLNYLWKNGVKDATGDLISYHDTAGNTPPKNPSLYTKYMKGNEDTGFYVIKDALLGKLRELDEAVSQAGNEVMKPLVKGLIEQVNSTFGTSYESQVHKDDKTGAPTAPHTDVAGNSSLPTAQPIAQGTPGNLQNISYNPNDPNAQNASNTQEESHGNGANSSLQTLLGNLPFQTADALSPYAMQSFIGNAANLASALQPQLKDGRLNVELTQFANSINSEVSEWNSFVNSPPVGGVGGANASAYQTEVPYDRANRPFSTLETIFGSQFKAKESVQRLLQMVLLVQQTIASIKRSPMLTNAIGSNILDNQSRQATAFTNSLTAYSR